MRTLRSVVTSLSVISACAIAACSTPAVTSSGPPGLTCSPAGEATPGPADKHCVGQPVQSVNPASCFPDAGSAGTEASAEGGDDGGGSGDDGGSGSDGGGGSANDCAYGATMFGPAATDGGPVAIQGDDDDCKYHVSWTSKPICESTLGVIFTVAVTYLGTNTPVTNIPSDEGILVEAFIPTTLDAACDVVTRHFSPTRFDIGSGLVQTSPTSGVYTGPIIFDQPGEWTVRFHIHEECSDELDDSPHGHAAFHVTVP
jgi:hypothetical protein